MRKFSRDRGAGAQFDSEIEGLRAKYVELEGTPVTFTKFSEFPLSQKTQRGLKDAKYVHPTDIQRESILLALQGKDVLGSAITGSGKTLAFLIPVLEHLYLNKWTRTDGVGAIIISPTRELAFQIFEKLKQVGKHHDFSAGLIIGGKNLKFEKKRMDQCNILICTPGRLLQHMDENPLFNASTMEVLVLDEADRCLDLGFEKTINAIIDNLQPERQTLLFSATQTKSVKDLARLSLKDPVYVGLKKDDTVVPTLLQQNYVVVSLEDKLTMLWSFIKNHLKQKIIVFFASCKQVKYVYEIFCKLRPGTSLLALYGTLHQDRRIAVYNEFVKKSNVVMFATDIASRGLDFPSVNWVVQMDCPEDVNQYIHRAGRSARNKERGESLLVLMPTEEEGMLEELKKKSIDVRKIQIDSRKLFSPRAKIEAFLAQNPELKASAQRAFLSYIKSVYIMKNKKIFNVNTINFDEFSKSLGLVITPRIRFLERRFKNTIAENVNVADKISLKPNEANSDSDSDDLFTVKRVDYYEIKDEDSVIMPTKREKLITKASLAKKVLKKKILPNVIRKFDAEGTEIRDVRREMQSELSRRSDQDNNSDGGIDIEMSKKLISEEDKYDKKRFREMVKIKHKTLKKKKKEISIAEYSSGNESDHSVDLSWLPDPDTVYNNQKSDTVKTKSKTNSSKTKPSGPSVKKRKVAPELSLQDAEAIASQLLLN